MTGPSRLAVVAVLFALGLLLAPDLTAGFRSEDFLDFDWYSRVPPSDVLTEPHLGSTMVTYWRPLADAVTWGLVRTVGPRPAVIHLLLLVLHVVAALSVGVALRRLFGLNPGAALAAAMLALVHPWSAAVVTYLDGGLPMLLVAIALFQALAALGRWRDGAGPWWPVAGFTVAAMLAHDLAIILPVILVVVALLLPPSERRAPWALLLTIPLLLVARFGLLGKAFDGYATLPSLADPKGPEQLLALLGAFPGRIAQTGLRLFVPVFPGELHPHWAWIPAIGAPLVVGIVAVVFAVTTRRGALATPVRQGLAALALVVGLLGFAAEFFVMAPSPEFRPDELVLAYKTYPAALAAALAIAWLLGRAAGRTWWMGPALAAPCCAVLLWLRAPIADAHDQALRWGRELPDAIAARTEENPVARVVVLEVPVRTDRGTPGHEVRPVTRAFQWGLSSALRPPLVERERFVYPLFRVDHGMHAYFAREAIDAFAAVPWLMPLRCRYDESGGGVSVAPVERPILLPSTVQLFASVEDAPRVLAPDLSNAPRVEVRRYEFPDAKEGPKALDVVELGISGTAQGDPSLVVLNRVHPFDTPVLHREKGPQGIDRVYFSVFWFREVATRFPDDVVFVALQSRPKKAAGAVEFPPADVSNVLAIRLFVGAD